MIARDFDDEAGIIRVKVEGEWDFGEVEAHFSILKAMIEGLRQKSIPIRVLVDVREASDRSPTMEAYIGGRKVSLYRPGDRVAILTRGLEDKEHVRGFLDGADVWAWQSAIAAEQWLLMPDEVPKAP